MFDNESEQINHKGLFTFYRQQAEYDQKVRKEKALTQKGIINEEKTRIQQKDGNQKEGAGQPIQKSKRQSKQRRSFEELNKEYIKKLSGKKSVTPVANSKQLGSEVVVILKGNRNKLKQDLKLNKLNLRYQSQQYSFMGRKASNSFQDLNSPQTYFPNHMQDNEEQDATFKKNMRRNQSLNDRYLHSKSKLEGELLVSKEIKSNAHPFEPIKFEAVKKINILEEAALNNKQSEALKYEVQSAHRRVPPKLLASILKSQTNEIIRSMRRSIEKEKIGKLQAQGQNHSYIEYGNYEFEKISLDVSGLNQKQRRLISIFSKFNKKL